MNPYIGHRTQEYGVEEHRLVGGKGDGMRLFEINNGKGLEITVSPDRAGDITRLRYKGINMSFMSPCGYVAPAYSTYTLKMVDCDPERLFNLFCPEGHGSYTMEERGNCIVYDESSGKQLVIYEDSIDYRTYNFKTEDRPMQDLEALMYYHTVEHANAAPHDLSFMSVDNMEKFGRDLLTRLGIVWEPKLFRCVTLSGKEIMDFQQELFGDGGIYVQLGITATSLTAAEDACYLQFNFAWDGISLIGFDEPTASSYENFGASPDAKATIMITGDGIQTCTVSFPCTVETAYDPKPILNMEEAISLLKDKYDLQILDAPRKVVDVWMEYIPVKRDEEWVLTPYWCFRQVDEKTIGSRSYFGSADRFNAITGKDLTYGGYAVRRKGKG